MRMFHKNLTKEDKIKLYKGINLYHIEAIKNILVSARFLNNNTGEVKEAEKLYNLLHNFTLGWGKLKNYQQIKNIKN